MSMKVLIVEDEYNLADAIKERLEKEKLTVNIVEDGEEGYYYASTNTYDLIILDVMLPNMSGFQILNKLRTDNINSKIIMLTARSTIEDKLNGLENGADDYLTKPFHMDELVARVNIQLKRNGNKNNLSFGDLVLNTTTLKVTCTKTNEVVELIKKEFQLLEYFINNPNQVLSKEQIYDRVWGIENEIESNNLEAYLSFIRKKLRAIESNVVIKSVRGMGYKIEYGNKEIK
jgi:DNA-binding response OmpR family regulator